MRKFYALAATLLLSAPAFADINLRFVEGAPKDRFIIQNAACALSQVDVLIDLSGSAGALIFDVTAAGAGVEVFQPVEVQSRSVTAKPVTDGDQQLSLTIDAFEAGSELIISADLDDVLSDSALGQIRVTGNELAGTMLRITIDGQSQQATFSASSNAVSIPHACTS
jgi:hypothetical protein